MDRPTLEVADVFRQHGDAYRAQAGGSLSTAERRVMTAIEACRTAALGGHVEQCDRCGHQRVWYNSCRNRHCPTCQSLARAAWIDARRADLLPVDYFHVVFTVPPAVAAIAYQNKAVVSGLLFRAVAETLRTIAADPRHLGAQIGFFAVLHTWGQTLVHHPHLHCVVPGGGLSPDGTQWGSCRPGFFLPVRVLSRLVRRLLLDAVCEAFETGQLHFAGTLDALNDRQHFAAHLQPARQTDWVVYAKPPFAGPDQVESLNLRFFIDTQHQGMIGRVEIQPDDIAHLLDQQRVGRQREGLRAMRLQATGPPDAGDRPVTQAGRLRQRPGAPVGRSVRGRLQGADDHGLDGVIGDGPWGTWARFVQQPVHAARHKAGAPAAHHLGRDTQLLGHGLVVPPCANDL